MRNRINFTVYGRPQQRGSKRAMPNPKGGRPFMVDTNAKSKPWMAAVASAAAEAMNGRDLLEGPLRLIVEFHFKRPKSHFLKSGLRENAPVHHASPPDADKAMRSIGDALTGVVYRDDAQLANVTIHKFYTSESERAEVEIEPLPI